MIATHLGVIDESAIDNMSLLFFENVLEELGKKLNYDAVVNYAGNSFCEKSWEMIQKAFPLGENEDKGGSSSIAAFFENARIVKKNNDGTDTIV